MAIDVPRAVHELLFARRFKRSEVENQCGDGLLGCSHWWRAVSAFTPDLGWCGRDRKRPGK
jgi:hypothetical protein